MISQIISCYNSTKINNDLNYWNAMIRFISTCHACMHARALNRSTHLWINSPVNSADSSPTKGTNYTSADSDVDCPCSPTSTPSLGGQRMSIWTQMAYEYDDPFTLFLKIFFVIFYFLTFIISIIKRRIRKIKRSQIYTDINTESILNTCFLWSPCWSHTFHLSPLNTTSLSPQVPAFK